MTAPLEPEVWPACSKCGTACVFCRRMSLDRDTNTLGYRWVWVRECAHKSAPFVLVNENGPVETG